MIFFAAYTAAHSQQPPKIATSREGVTNTWFLQLTQVSPRTASQSL